MRTVGSFWLILVLWSMPAAGRDIFVDNLAGNDRATGDQPRHTADLTGPVRTISKALFLSANADAIVLTKTSQPYRESLSLVGSRNSGFADHPFAIRGNGAILDGSAPVPARRLGTLFRPGVSLPPAADGISTVVSRRPARHAGSRHWNAAQAAATRAPPVVLPLRA